MGRLCARLLDAYVRAWTTLLENRNRMSERYIAERILTYGM